MLINTGNYFDYVAKIGVENLTPARKEMHMTLAKYTKDGQDWSILNKLKDKEAIDIQFQAIEKLYERLNDKPIMPVKETKPEEKKKEEATVRDHPAATKSKVTEEEAHDAAIKLIEAYVKRGDSYESLRERHLDVATEFWASIEKNKIRVTKVKGKSTDYSFSLKKIYTEIQAGMEEKEGNKSSGAKNTAHKKPKFSGKGVELVSPEVTFIKRFALLHGKEKNRQQVLSFIKAIQKAIVERKIRKNSKHAKVIQFIQSQLVKTYNSMSESIAFRFTDKDHMKYLKIAGAEYLLPSVRFIKSYIGMLGQNITKQRASNLLEKITLALENKIISPSDRYIKELRTVTTSIEKFLKSGDSPNLTETQLNGLEGVLADCGCSLHGPGYKESYGSALYGVDEPETETIPRNTILNSKDVVNLKSEKLGFQGKWRDFIGNPSRGFTMMIYGKPKFGKSFLAVEFAGYLARNHGRVLYVAREEGFDDTIQDKIREKDVEHENLDVADYLPKDLSGYDFVFLDSVNKLDLSPADVEKLEKKYPGTSFIYIFQCLKDGKYRGSMEFSHNVDSIVEVPEKGQAVQYGRYNQGGELKIFE